MVGGRSRGSRGGSGGAMAGPRRDQTQKRWFRGAHGGRWGDDGWPVSRARWSAGVYGGILRADERPGGGIAGRNRPDEVVGVAGVLYA